MGNSQEVGLFWLFDDSVSCPNPFYIIVLGTRILRKKLNRCVVSKKSD